MRAKSPRGPAGTAEPRRGVAGLLLVAGLLSALAAAATLAGPALVEEGLASPVGIVVLAGAALVALVAATAVAAVRRGRRQRAASTQEALAWFEGLHVCTAVATRNLVRAEAKEDRSVERVLRMQVASLERALEGQDERLAEAIREEHRKTLLTITALRRTLGNEPGEVALNRLEAALARLGVTPDFTRPALPAGRTGAPVVFLGAPQPLVAAAAATGAPVATTPAPRPDEPAPAAGPGEPTAEPTAPMADVTLEQSRQPLQDVDAPAAPAFDDDAADETAVDGERRPDTAPAAPTRPVVRPVPAPVRPSAPHRGRRRFGRPAARV